MITYQDFVPRMLTESGFFQDAEYETFEAAVIAANWWIQQNQIQVISIETVVLPNIWNPKEQGTVDAALRTSGDVGSYWHQFLRIWYRAG